MLNIPHRNDLLTRPIETDRLLLHPLDLSDATEVWHAVDSSRSHLQHWLPWVAFSLDAEATRRFIEMSIFEWDQGRALRFAIREKIHRMLVGVIGFENIVHLHRSCELGYWLRQEATRRGLITEACSMLIRVAFHSIGIHRIRIAAATDNHASLNVIRRLGFHFEGVARQAEWCDGRWLNHAVFGMLSTDVYPPPNSS